MVPIRDKPELIKHETGALTSCKWRLDALTGLRFFAAAAIVLHHLPGTFGIEHGYLGDARLAQGVSVFFVLSGFVLRYAYPQLGSMREVRQFLVARVARIWPLHVLTLLAAVLIRGYPEIWTFLANFFLLQSWIPKGIYFFGYNSVSWSISTEFAFYLAFPVLLLHFRHDWWWKLLACATVSFAIALYVGAMGVPEFDGNMKTVVMQGFIMSNPVARLFEFVLGMACAQLWLGTTPRGGTAVWTALELAAVAFLLLNVSIILYTIIPLLPATIPVRFWAALIASPALPVAILL
ncbi:MAG: acyltransferase, partial [Mangrovicoccus sp.]|nr:acyltransferase [Mangrovicoccus sp.]